MRNSDRCGEASLPTPIDADLGDRIAAGELGPVPRDLPEFERRFMDVVGDGWDAFYDATLDRVAKGWDDRPQGTGTVATFTRIWSRAASLSRGSVLDVGTCFGFLPLAWPDPPRLAAVDLDAGSVAMISRQARRLGRDVHLARADATRLPFPDDAFDTVLLLHLLEHLPPDAADEAVAEARRVAGTRVVVAVPVEPEADPVFGHLQTYDAARLAAIGTTVFEADGAWLILDQSSRPS